LDKITQFLQLLTDGKWHSLEELQRKMQLSRDRMKQIAKFLQNYEFVAEDETGKKLKIIDSARKFLVETTTS
jgi:DNA-binding IclR family transcriptional regulator